MSHVIHSATSETVHNKDRNSLGELVGN